MPEKTKKKPAGKKRQTSRGARRARPRKFQAGFPVLDINKSDESWLGELRKIRRQEGLNEFE